MNLPGPQPPAVATTAKNLKKTGALLAYPGRAIQIVVVVVVSVLLYSLNNLAQLSGWLHAPEGFVSTFVSRAPDFAQYATWTSGFRFDNLIPNYHYPLPTDPGFFNPFFWAVGQVMNITGWPFSVPYHLAGFSFTALAVASIWLLLQSFSPRQKLLATALIFCVLPLQSVIVPVVQFVSGPSLAEADFGDVVLAGFGDIVFPTSDGLLHGISGGALVTLGTAATVYAFVLIHRFILSGQGLWLICLVAFGISFLHPFEGVTIAGVGGMGLLLLRDGPIQERIRAPFLVGCAAAAGILPYVVLTFSVDWVQRAANLNQWDTPGPLRLYMMLGLPAIIATLLTPLSWIRGAVGDRLLVIWFVGTIILLYVPLIPHSQHLMDGFHYATAVLLARQIALTGLELTRPRSLVVVAWLFWSLATWSVYYSKSYLDGMNPDRLLTSLQPASEHDAIKWLRANASRQSTLLTPLETGGWYASVPIHTLASHYLFSLDYDEQAEGVGRFYAGEFTALEARDFLDRYRVNYIVVPTEQSDLAYLAGLSPEVTFGTHSIFHLPR